MGELPQRYDPHEAEPRWQRRWQELGIHKHDPASDAEAFSVDTPPPTVSGRMHLGHSFSYAQQDYIVRYHRMRGKNVRYPFGTDDNGLATDKLVEKTRKIRSKDHTREEYRKICLEFVKEELPQFTADWIRLGMSCDFTEPYSTIDEASQRIGQKSFRELHEKGLVYREDAPVAWCPTCRTAIAQAEFENVEKESAFNDIAFSCDGEELVIATTRPELIPACVAIAAHPEDERYAKHAGKFVKVPLCDYEVPLIHDEAVELDKGTGLMMVCTFGDKEDVEKWRKHDLQLRVIFTEDGTVNELGGTYEGMKILDARKAILADLEEAGMLKNTSTITHAANVHERCGTPIEFLKRPQWFVRIMDKKEELLALGKRINWYPQHMRVRYEHWVQNLHSDWCISRQRSYGVPFPVWYDADGRIIVAEEDQLPVDPTTEKPLGYADAAVTPETDVLDTWMISSMSPHLALGWKDGKPDGYPMTLRPQAHDIIRTWAFYTIVKGLYHHGEQPWRDIVISGHVLDPKGQKMSKSRGNVVAPQDVIGKYSADALRFWAAGVKLGEDLPYMEKDLQTGQKTMTKLWNATRFALLHLQDYRGFDGELAVIDKWILSRFSRVVQDVTKAFEQYEYSKCRFSTEQFFWQVLCDNYLELVKDRLYNAEAYGERTLSAKHTLYSVTLGVLKLFAPILPHIAEEIYQSYYRTHDKAESIHVSRWPDARPELIDDEAEKLGDEVVRILAAVRKYKSDNQLSMKAELAKLKVTTELDLTLVEQDLLAVTGAKDLEHAKGAFAVEIIPHRE